MVVRKSLLDNDNVRIVQAASYALEKFGRADALLPCKNGRSAKDEIIT
jgi:hypothetical protein